MGHVIGGVIYMCDLEQVYLELNYCGVEFVVLVVVLNIFEVFFS